MSHPHSAQLPAATRQLPVARGRKRKLASDARARNNGPTSETRLQAAVARQDEATDPYADPPCTD